jgi:hypothetical protein
MRRCYRTQEMRRICSVLALVALVGCQSPQAVDRVGPLLTPDRPPDAGSKSPPKPAPADPGMANPAGEPDGGSNAGAGGSSTGGGSTGGSSGSSPGGASPEADAAPAPVVPPVVPTKLANGQPCNAASDCQSAFCVDGLCCLTACDSGCQACDVGGAEGTCVPVPAGQDPDNDCTQQAATSCGTDGTCDGKGACKRYPAGSQCGGGTCAAGVEHAASVCDGQGKCSPGASKACPSGICTGTSCGAACTADSQCQAGFFCDAGSCKTKRALAAACTSNGQCASAHCADGVCCATDCSQACYACNLAASKGSCMAVGDGLDPDSECVAEPAETCGRRGGCNGRGACRLHPATTTCGAASCTDATGTSARTCDGAGQCAPATSKSCGAYLCKGTACGTTCAGNADCKSGLVCTEGACVTPPPPPPAAKVTNLTVHDTAHADEWSLQKNFQIGMAGARPWTDWPNSYIVSVDAGATVMGADWIKVAAESKKYTGGPQATVTLGGTATVWLAVDDRWGSNPAWLAGWTKTAFKAQVFESSSKTYPFTMWRKTGQTGMVALPKIADNDAYDYFAIIE